MAKKPTKPAASAKPASPSKPTPAAKPAAAAKHPALTDLRHPQATRKNNPPATLASEGIVPTIPKATYAYNPHLPPVLRFDSSGTPDHLATIAAKLAAKQDLTPDERAIATTLLQHLSSDPGGISHPWLEWTNKRELPSFAVDPVALHIHERVSAQAILKVAARQDVNKDLFADPEQDYKDAVQFYKHDVNWSNRLILGDSLQVMSSLARREDLAGKVQMIYMDPPYGIKFASNFQPEVGKRDVKDKQEDLTREPEMVRAYRDTWHLGIHSYLSYLRDRLIVAKELLADTGSIFVQISDENLHLVRNVLDEVFGVDQLCSLVTVWKTSSATSTLLPTTSDYLLWYARDISKVRYRQTYLRKDPSDPSSGGSEYKFAELPLGERRSVSQLSQSERLSAVLFRPSPTTSQSGSDSTRMPVTIGGRIFRPGPGGWKTNASGFERLTRAERLLPRDQSISYIRYLLDFPVAPVSNLWTDVRWGFDAAEKRYVVETNPGVIERCMLMTTDPGDLVLDPTCGSGTTAYVAEQWGRRWITTDTSRVAVAIARQRLLTSKFDMYRTKDGSSSPRSEGFSSWGDGKEPHRKEENTDRSRESTHRKQENADRNEENADRRGENTRFAGSPAPRPVANSHHSAVGTLCDPARGFLYETVPHITLKSIAQNVALDPIFARHEPILDRALEACNIILKKGKDAERREACECLARTVARTGLSSITDADRRRWLLPGTTPQMVAEVFDDIFRKFDRKPLLKKQVDGIAECIPQRARHGKSSIAEKSVGWEHWQVPFDAPNEKWPVGLAEAVTAYRAAWRAKMDEVNACIAASAEQEELVDQPEIIKNVVRVSGPFTVEGVQPPELSLGDVVSMGEPASGPGFAGGPDELDQQFPIREVVPTNTLQVANVGAYLDAMLRYLRADGVRFLNNKQMVWSRLDAMYESGKAGPFHAEGRWAPQGETDADPHGRANVAVVIGPQYGPVTQQVVADAVRLANIRGYEHLVIAAFNFDAAALTLGESQHRHVTTHLAHIRPDINPGMNGLLKESPKPGSGQLFTVFGQPRISVEGPGKKGSDTEGLYIVKMEGVDIYDPVRDEITPTNAGKVAAWFLDTDYDGITFCITQAFFPDKSAWDKLRRALNGKDGLIDEERFDQLSKDVSLPFPRGKHGRIAVKVIDPRGNEVMAVEEVG